MGILSAVGSRGSTVYQLMVSIWINKETSGIAVLITVLHLFNMSAKTSEFDMGMGEFFDMALGCLGISA